ncbi:MAG: serine/threonine-protein kinase [Acidobacteriota bacterium]
MSDETSVVRTIGRFHAVDELGRGGMGIVYRGFDPVIGRTVALKTIGFSSDDEEARQLRQRLYREAAAAGTLTHPNIVTIYDVVEDGSTTAVAMEFVEGQTLDAVIEQRGALPLDQAIDVFGQVCAALDYAGSRGIVHRDVKPANILITVDGKVKITDFGIARMNLSGLTQTGTILGSPSYMSPEQVRGLPLDSRSDLFSAAVVLFQMLTGERPFAGNDVATTMYRIVNEPPPALETFNQTINPAVTAVLHRALAKDPADRYQSGADLIAALRQAIQGGAPPAFDRTVAQLPPALPARAPLPRRRLWLVAGGGAIVILLLLLILAGGGGPDDGQAPAQEAAAMAASDSSGAQAGLAGPASGGVDIPAPATQEAGAGQSAGATGAYGPVSTVPEPAAVSTVPPPAPPKPPVEARPSRTSAPPRDVEPVRTPPERPRPQAADVQEARTRYREARSEPERPSPPAGGAPPQPPAMPPAAAPPPVVPAPVSSDAWLRVMFEASPYPVSIYADDAVVGRVDQAGAIVTVQAGSVHLKAVNDAIYLNADLGTVGLRPGDRKSLSLPGTASAVLAVRGENYQGVRILIDGRQVAAPYPAQVQRIAAGTHRVTFRWVSGSTAGQELAATVNLTSGGHYVIRAVPENADVVVQQVR